jgi:KTSC domain
MMNEWKSLLKEFIQAAMQLIQSGEHIPDELYGVAANTLGRLFERYEQEEERLRTEREQPPLPPIQTGPSNDAQLLWVLAGQDPQAFISYLRTFPTPGTSALLNDPHALNATIEQLQRMMPPGEPLVVDGIPHADLQSSNVWGAAYDRKSGKMRVRFQGGSEYEYDGVPENIFNAFIKGNAVARTTGHNQYGRWWRGKNPSIGAAMNQYIKQGNFPYRRIR